MSPVSFIERCSLALLAEGYAAFSIGKSTYGAISSSSGSGGSGSGAAGASTSGFMAFLALLFNLALVFAPHIGYAIQYISIVQTNNIDGYSPVVSVILLVSNTIRVYYYPGAHYAVALLFQALMAILTHSLLLHKVLCIHHELAREAAESRVLDYMSGVHTTEAADAARKQRQQQQSLSAGRGAYGNGDPMMQAGGQPAYGLGGVGPSYNIDLGGVGSSPTFSGTDGGVTFAVNSSDTDDDNATCVELGVLRRGNFRLLYVICDAIEASVKALEPPQFLAYYGTAAVVGFLSCLLLFALTGFASGLVAAVGYVALGIEVTLVIPQILRNAKRRSTEGLTVMLIITWVGGDIAKIIYFIVANQPLPFTICGVLQLALDGIVVRQLFLYREPAIPSTVMGLPPI